MVLPPLSCPSLQAALNPSSSLFPWWGAERGSRGVLAGTRGQATMGMSTEPGEVIKAQLFHVLLASCWWNSPPPGPPSPAPVSAWRMTQEPPALAPRAHSALHWRVAMSLGRVATRRDHPTAGNIPCKVHSTLSKESSGPLRFRLRLWSVVFNSERDFEVFTLHSKVTGILK